MSLNFNGNYIGGVPSGGGGGGTPYILPVASTTTLGGVKIDGTSITIDDGVISSEGGGVSDHAQLTNLDYANSGHTGFMKNDASNLTTDGQKVFDGQWVSNRVRITNGYVTYPQTEEVEYSLANYLPNDNYMYEININGAIQATAYGKEARIEIKTDVFSQVILCSTFKQSNDANTPLAAGSTVIPVGLGRKIIVNPLSWSMGEYSLWVVGYRRIGTNQ